MVFAPAFVAMKNACCAAGAVPTPVIDYEKAVLCAPNGDRVIVISAITAGVPIPTGYNMDGTVYAGPLSALVACDTADVESDAVLMCDGGTVEFLRWFVKRDGLIVGTPFDTTMAGVAYVPVGVVTMGACVVPAAQVPIVGDGINIASGTFFPDYTPVHQISNWNYTGGNRLQSVTVTATRAGSPGSGNTIQISLASGQVLFLLQGETKEWSVAQDAANVSETLFTGFQVDALGNSAASIIWTEQA